jgi:hypothetical protein
MLRAIDHFNPERRSECLDTLTTAPKFPYSEAVREWVTDGAETVADFVRDDVIERDGVGD